MHSIPPQLWSAFRASLNKDLKTSLWIAVLLKFQAAPRTALRTSRVCQAPANPRGYVSQIRITYTVEPAMLYVASSCFQHSPVQPLARPHQLQALAAADACAENDLVGIGGWAITSSQVVWYLEHAGHTGSMALPCQAWTAIHRMFQNVGAAAGHP